MATDPGLLTQWYSDYQKANPPAAAPAPAAATATAAPAPASTGMLASAPAPAGFTPAQATATNWTPDANSTVAGQVAKITAAGSPLIDQATTAAKQQTSARGLLNSSLGVTAGLDAAYRTALPIAQQDANTYGEAGKFNATTANSTSQFNVGQTNEAGMQQAGFTQQTALQDKDFAQQNRTQAADLASRYDLANMDVQSRAALQAADAANQQKLQQANAALQTGLQASDNAVKQSMQAYDAALKQSMQGLDNASRLQLATLDADNRVVLANLEAKYKNELQANQSMAASYQSMVDSYTRVMMSPDLDADAKATVTGNITQLYENTLRMQADISGLQIGSLLGVPDNAAGSPTPQGPPMLSAVGNFMGNLPKPLVPRLQPIAKKPETGKFAGMLSDFADNQGGQNGGP